MADDWLSAVIGVIISTATDPLELQDSVGARALSCGPDGGVVNLGLYRSRSLSFGGRSRSSLTSCAVPKLKLMRRVDLVPPTS